MENKAFIARCIDSLQHQSIEDGLFAIVRTQHLMKNRKISYDLEHDLFWVNHPFHGQQVAVWMMPLVMKGKYL